MVCGIAVSKHPRQGHLQDSSPYIYSFLSSNFFFASPIRAQFQLRFPFISRWLKIFFNKRRSECGTLLSPLVKSSPLQFYAFNFNFNSPHLSFVIFMYYLFSFIRQYLFPFFFHWKEDWWIKGFRGFIISKLFVVLDRYWMDLGSKKLL